MQTAVHPEKRLFCSSIASMVYRKMKVLHRMRKVPAQDERKKLHQDCIVDTH